MHSNVWRDSVKNACTVLLLFFEKTVQLNNILNFRDNETDFTKVKNEKSEKNRSTNVPQ